MGILSHGCVSERVVSWFCKLTASALRQFWCPRSNGLLNACQAHSLKCVHNINSILSVIFNAVYGAVCIQLTHWSYDDCQNTYTLSYHHHHQIGSMTHLPLCRARPWDNNMGCMSYYIHTISDFELPRPITDLEGFCDFFLWLAITLRYPFITLDWTCYRGTLLFVSRLHSQIR